MTITEALRAGARVIRPWAEATLASGVSVPLGAADILSFDVQEGADAALTPGCVISAACALRLDNAGGRWQTGGASMGARSWEGATLRLGVAVEADGAWLEAPAGTFIVEKVEAQERGGALTLSGADSIGSELAAPFVDGGYPCTLEALWRRAVGQSRYVWSGDVPGGGAVLDSAPEWGGMSLRQAMGCIAAAAGCFVRLNREGALELRPCRAEETAAIHPDGYMNLRRGFAAFGPVKALRVTPCAGAARTQTPLTVGDAGAGETLSVENNPLFVEGAPHLRALAEGMLTQLDGLTLEKASFRWRGDPALGVGDRVRLWDVDGGEHLLTITRQTLRFDGGFSAECACEIPSAAGSGLLRAITPEGGVNAAALVGVVDGGLLAANSVTARAIRAGSVSAEKIEAGAVTADKLEAGAVTADKIRAGAVEAGHLAAGAVDAQSVAAVCASLGQVSAANVDTHALSASLARVMRAVVERLEAGDVAADTLSAALADLVAARASTLDVGFERVKDLTAGEAVITQGAAGELYIRRLAVTSAMMVSAALGELVLRGEDGGYYRLTVRADGGLGVESAAVSDGEIAAGQTQDGRAILETDADIIRLNAQRLKAESAVVGEILAQALSAGRITAGQALIASATVPELYTAALKALGDTLDISANRAIHLIVGDVAAARASAQRAEEGLAAREAVVGEVIAVEKAAAAAPESLMLYGRCAGTGAPSPDAPCAWTAAGAGGAVTLRRCGANLALDVSGVNPVAGFVCAGQTYTVGWKQSAAAGFTLQYASDRAPIEEVRVMDTGERAWAVFTARRTDGLRVNNWAGRDQREYTLCLGAADAFPEYVPPRNVSASVATPGGLWGVPTALEGTWTDGAGQRWLADEVNLTAGTRTRRVHVVQVTGEEPMQMSGRSLRVTLPSDAPTPMEFDAGVVRPGLSTHFAFSSPEAVWQGAKEGICTAQYVDGWAKRLCLYASALSDVDSARAWLREHQPTFIYPVAEPIVEALDEGLPPAALTLLQGANRLYTEDAAQPGIGIRYLRDGSIAEGLLAASGAAATADQAQRAAEAAQRSAMDAASAASIASDIADSAEDTAKQVRAWFTFDADGLRTRREGSRWSTRTGEDGFYIDHDEVPGHVAAFHRDLLEARAVKLGNVVARPSAAGGWVWMADDGV